VVVTGDLREIAQVTPAMADVDRVFFTYPVTDGLLDATACVAAAARAAGVRRLVNVSQLRPAPGAPSPRTRQHWVSEKVFDWAALLGDPLRRAEPFYRLVGGVPTIAEIVAEFGATLGSLLRYSNVDEQQWREKALAQQWDPHALEHLSRLWQVFGNAGTRDATMLHVTDAIEHLTGARAESLPQFVQANREALPSGSR
jgi:hypothetical protein